VCIDHEVRINRLENDNDIIEGLDGLLPAVLILSTFFAGVGYMEWDSGRGPPDVAEIAKPPGARDFP
jgi:hypothetical protein